jgi:hypothetical protein
MTDPSLAELLNTWQRWSYRDLLIRAHTMALATGDTDGADHLRRGLDLEPTVGPLDALVANHTLVSLLRGWQWHAIRAAREAGAGWDRIGSTLGMTAEQVRAGYLDFIERSERYLPDLADTARYRAVLDDPPLAAASQHQATASQPDAAAAAPGPWVDGPWVDGPSVDGPSVDRPPLHRPAAHRPATGRGQGGRW